MSCYHQKSRFYYEDSIKHSRDPQYFQSTLCESYEKFLENECIGNELLPMGESLTLEMIKNLSMKSSKEKKFYLKTNVRAPFDS